MFRKDESEHGVGGGIISQGSRARRWWSWNCKQIADVQNGITATYCQRDLKKAVGNTKCRYTTTTGRGKGPSHAQSTSRFCLGTVSGLWGRPRVHPPPTPASFPPSPPSFSLLPSSFAPSPTLRIV